MDVLILALLAVILGLVAFTVLTTRDRQRALDAATRSQEALQQRFDSLGLGFNQRLDGIQTTVSSSLTAANQTIGRIGEQLGALTKSSQRMEELARDISSLQDILKPPNVRGSFGELLLEQLLEQLVPGFYDTQYRFRDNTAVDAIVRLGQGIVPIDSKFPLESFTRLIEAPSDDERLRLRRDFDRAVRGHVDKVATYIRPDEGTFDFALMYIPAEPVYYEIGVASVREDRELITYAYGKRVFPVSPNILYVYLCAIGLGLKGLRIEEQAREVIDHLAHLSHDFARIREDFAVLGTHLGHARTRYEDLDRAVSRFGDGLNRPLRPDLGGASDPPRLPGVG